MNTIFRIFSLVYLNGRQWFPVGKLSCFIALVTARVHWQKQWFNIAEHRRHCSTAASISLVHCVTFAFRSVKIHQKPHNYTQKRTDWGSRPAAHMLSELKLLFLSMESGGFDKSSDGNWSRLRVPSCDGQSDEKVKQWKYSQYSIHLNW